MAAIITKFRRKNKTINLPTNGFNSRHRIQTTKKMFPMRTIVSSLEGIKGRMVFQSFSKSPQPDGRVLFNSFAGGTPNTTVKIFTKEQVEELLETKATTADRFSLVDVREPEELVDGIIPTAVNIPLGQVQTAMRMPPDAFETEYGFECPFEDDKLLIFYCRVGARSQVAAELAVEEGFENIGNYRGSALEWFGTSSR